MIRIFKKKDILEEPIEYSENWFDKYSDMSLRDLYNDYKHIKFDFHDEFILDLSYKIKSAFSIPFDDIKPFESTLLYSRLQSDVKDCLMSVGTSILRNFYYEMINILKDEYVSGIEDRVKTNYEKNTLSYILGTIHQLCEDCFHDILFFSAKALEELQKNKLFKYADADALLCEIIKNKIQSKHFSREQLRFTYKNHQSMRDKWYEIAIKHTVDKLNGLPSEDKLALIPIIKNYLHNEQNFKVAKGFEYKGIDGLEKFYKLLLVRYERINNGVNSIDNSEKLFFMIGKKGDTEKEIIDKKQLLRKFLKFIKYKFADSPSIEALESLYDEKGKYVENFDFTGDYKEFQRIISFLQYKKILGSKNINKVICSRILFNGKKLEKSSGTMSSERSQIYFDKKSDWYKDYCYILDAK